jgi:hypothetical protein
MILIKKLAAFFSLFLGLAAFFVAAAAKPPTPAPAISASAASCLQPTQQSHLKR